MIKLYLNSNGVYVFCYIFFLDGKCNIASSYIASKFRKLASMVLFLAKVQLVCILCSLIYPLMNITLI